MKFFLTKIKTTLTIPFDPLDEKTNRDAVVGALLNIIIFVTGVYLVPLILTRGFASIQVRIILLVLLIFITLRFVLSKGHAKIVSFVLLLVVWVTLMIVFLSFENGLRAPAFTASLAFIIVYAGLLHGRRVAWAFTVASLAINILVAIGESWGYFLTEPAIPSIPWIIFGQIVFFTGITYLLSTTLRNLRKSIGLYQAESETRLKAELEIRQLHNELETAYQTTLEGWALALELRDKETEGHSRRVTESAMQLARKMGMDEAKIKYIYYGALLHDIGKMGVPDEILNKPGSLNEEEWALIHQHPTFAYELLKDIEYIQPAISIPFSHHEHWDGTGYPQGLKGEEIPLPARIFTVIDIWDALLSDRPYRSAWSQEKVLEYIQMQRGKIFDPEVANVFLTMVTDEQLT